MRRTDRETTEDDARDILEKAEYGVLSMVDSHLRPYSVPLNYCVAGGYIYFHCADEGMKISVLESRPEVRFCVVASTELLPGTFGTLYESAIVDGRVAEVFDAEKRTGLEGLIEKYSSEFRVEGMKYIEKLEKRTRVFRVGIDQITGKARRK